MNFNGFDFLREYDKNNDNKIDRNDKVWSRLVLWKDKNSDGHSTRMSLFAFRIREYLKFHLKSIIRTLLR